MAESFEKPTDKIILCILDGWGIAPPSAFNAIDQAHTPTYDYLLKNFPSTKLNASGNCVGLPLDQMGNSEVGHLTIGSGRVTSQPLEKINNAINCGKLKDEAELILIANKINSVGGACHLIGMCSDGGVHGHIEHVLQLAFILASKKVYVHLHLITDGRDTSPYSASEFVKNTIKRVERFPSLIRISTITGRYYAMDRDNNWQRTAICYEAIISASGKSSNNFIESIEDSYKNNISDEFIKPLIDSDYKGILDGDTVIFANFRADRIRQLATSFIEDNNFAKFHRKKIISNFLFKLTMTEYSLKLSKKYRSIFANDKIQNSLGEFIAAKGLNQARIAETEKYAHVTYFFSGGREESFKNEDRILVPSHKVTTYDKYPQMASEEIKQNILKCVKDNKHDLIIANFAAPDMVGHTGNLDATITAIEYIDKCLTDIMHKILQTNYTLIITSDHGNCEAMRNPDSNEIITSHTKNLVPFILVNKKYTKDVVKLNNGSLADIAPTIIDLLKMPKPIQMTGNSLIKL